MRTICSASERTIPSEESAENRMKSTYETVTQYLFEL